MQNSAQEFIRSMKNPFRFNLFLFAKLPSAFFSGLKITSMDEQTCTVSIPYRWFTKNPFRSTYFACLSMAAEMSTGALASAHIDKREPAVSMLVVKMESSFVKKATGVTIFSCIQGNELKKTIDEAIFSGEGKTFTATSTGKNASGETVAEFLITWSFKARKK
jgi:hypothetical protein